MDDAKDNSISDIAECGIIMPIAEIGQCNEQHWQEVLSIISETISNAGLKAVPVWLGENDIIQGKIISNLYSKPIAICDVSCKNPNVMFELGMRLAFDKPTIVIKDDLTDYSFDTSPIEHLLYPRNLRYSAIVKFKKDLEEKIKKLYESTRDGKEHETFLKNFAQIVPSQLDKKEVSNTDLIMEEIQGVKRSINIMLKNNRNYNDISISDFKNKKNMSLSDIFDNTYKELLKQGININKLPHNDQMRLIGSLISENYDMRVSNNAIARYLNNMVDGNEI